MPEFVFTDGAVRFADAARAVADAARELQSFREVRAVTADAVQRGRCRIDQLAEELARAPARQSGWLRRTLAEVADGVRSVAEGDLRDLIRAAGLPAPVFNARLYIGPALLAVVDAWWPDAGVAVEVDSREWHLSPEDSRRTARRSRGMSAKGIIMLHVTPHQIRTEAEKIVADIRDALESGRARPLLAIRTLPAAG
jgi:very-short-patch-repair endonuclease